MKCFYENQGCAGSVKPAGGHRDAAWLNGSLDHDSGYCEAHMASALRDAKWEGVRRVFPEGEGVGAATARAHRMVRT